MTSIYATDYLIFFWTFVLCSSQHELIANLSFVCLYRLLGYFDVCIYTYRNIDDSVCTFFLTFNMPSPQGFNFKILLLNAPFFAACSAVQGVLIFQSMPVSNLNCPTYYSPLSHTSNKLLDIGSAMEDYQ